MNITAEEALDSPLFLRRVLQLHIIPVPLAKNVFQRDTLTVPTLDFGSRLRFSTSGDGVTTISNSEGSAKIVDIDMVDVCQVVNDTCKLV